MEKHVFRSLCKNLKDNYGLIESRDAGVDKQVAMFLNVLQYNLRNRMIQERFQRSGETVSRHFHVVLKAVMRLSMEIIKLPTSYNEVRKYIRRNPKYWPHFQVIGQDCIGAIDGTHIQAVLPIDKQVSYIGRKGYCTQNVMAACSFNMCFTFVWARDYYLVDVGYPNMKGYLAPYKAERYHLPDFHRGSQARGPRELFNQAHSSLRNVIEHSFRVLKARWQILSKMHPYEYDTQVDTVAASMALHNFIRWEAIVDEEFRIYDENQDYVPLRASNINLFGNDVEDDNEMGVVRESIAN
ncbi:hypothetical protein L1049_002887 [Liquidambar formosana]|uniref:DDE Tnp4 domain-containing protein n=1 Tax=Liquidambar formosana TaxID=63359 RepID=A0AAP0NL20_LIQFO